MTALEARRELCSIPKMGVDNSIAIANPTGCKILLTFLNFVIMRIITGVSRFSSPHKPVIRYAFISVHSGSFVQALKPPQV